MEFDWDRGSWWVKIKEHRLIKIIDNTLVVVFSRFKGFFVQNNPEAEA